MRFKSTLLVFLFFSTNLYCQDSYVTGDLYIGESNQQTNYDIKIKRNIPSSLGLVGLEAINPNSTGRSVILTGEADLGRYIYLGYFNSQFPAEPIDNVYSPGTGMIVTGAPNGMHLVSWHGNISFTAGGLNSYYHRLEITDTGNVGINTKFPKSKLQVTEGDIYVENIGNGVIMKSPNGLCWRYSPNDYGQLISTQIVCPN